MIYKKASTILISAIVMLSVALVATTIGEYAVDQYTLDITVTPIDSGTITYDPVGTGDPPEYDDDTVVALTPNADPGWTFDSWGGPNADDLVQDGDSWTIIMDDDKELTATFIEVFTLTIDILPIDSGNIIYDPIGTGDPPEYNDGTVVDIEAIAIPGWTFGYWDGDILSIDNPETITMDSDMYITANFFKIPGVNIFEGANNEVGDGSNDALITDLDELFYNNELDIELNDDLDWGTETYYLYYPVYTGNEEGEYYLEWNKWIEDGPVHNHVFENVKLLCSGLWIIDNDDEHDASTINLMEDTIPAWFWVNGSKLLKIEVSDDNIMYDDDSDITINVTRDDISYPASIAILHEYEDRVINVEGEPGDMWIIDGLLTFGSDNFTYAGEYKIYAYNDSDETKIFYEEDPWYFSDLYGKKIISDDADNYKYVLCGPWDPPELIAEPEIITVETSEPNILLDRSIIYWGFESIIKVNVTDNENHGLDEDISSIKVKNKHGEFVVSDNMNVTNIGDGEYEITFDRGADAWATFDNGNMNGTWYVYFGWDDDQDGIEEWNGSDKFSVRGTAPGVMVDVTNDGEGYPKDMTVDIWGDPIWIEFTIYGDTIFGDNAYYGDDLPEENGDNIRVSGDILYIPSEDDGTLQNLGEGKWMAEVIPARPGQIDISVDWEDNGYDTATIDIINGTYVDASIDSFPVDTDITFTVLVTNINQVPQEHADVWIFWKNGEDQIDHTVGDAKEGNGKDGIYEFTILSDDQRDIAPQDIIIEAMTPGFGFMGYDKITMDRNHDLVVSCTPTESYAGDETEYKINVSNLDGDIPDDIIIKLLDEECNEMDGYEWDGIEDGILIDSIILDPGTYQFYAYNDTHDSEGHNATITIHPYTVTCSPSVLAWLIDNDVDVTFTVLPADEGDLRIWNISDNPHAAIDGEYTDIEIINGTATLEEVNASDLGNVTFEYRPYGGDFKRAEGMIRVTTATATPNPSTVYMNEPTTVTVTITHPATGTALSGVKVGLESDILNSVPDDEITDINGNVQFGITTGGSGYITILIEDEFDENNEFVIRSTVRKTMKIDAPLTVNEGESFTISVKSGGNLITDKTVTIIVEGVGTYTTSSGSVSVVAPTVTTSMDYRIEATATGYTDDKVTIRVLNVPQLAILIDDTELNGKDQFTVTIIDDMGRTIIGAKVTFDGNEYTTDVDGQVSLIAPNEDGEFTISTSFGEYKGDSITVHITKVEEETPGFELLTLIVSIGVAFILLRRRKKI